MQFLLLLYGDETRYQNMNPTDRHNLMGRYMAFGQEHAPIIKGSNPLQPTHTARTVRVRDGKPLTTDGPFAETKEQLGGYYLIEANDIDEAAKIAAKVPAASTGCVEVRPIMVFS
jgi:hypothetical protein